MRNNNKGFSLVELIVVIAIMAILAAVAVAGFSIYIPKAQQAADNELLSVMSDALRMACYSEGVDPSAVRAEIAIQQDGSMKKTADGKIDIKLKAADGKQLEEAIDAAIANAFNQVVDANETFKLLNSGYASFDGVKFAHKANVLGGYTYNGKNYDLVINGNDFEAFKGTTFDAMGIDKLMDQMDSVIDFAQGKFENLGEDGLSHLREDADFIRFCNQYPEYATADQETKTKIEMLALVQYTALKSPDRDVDDLYNQFVSNPGGYQMGDGGLDIVANASMYSLGLSFAQTDEGKEIMQKKGWDPDTAEGIYNLMQYTEPVYVDGMLMPDEIGPNAFGKWLEENETTAKNDLAGFQGAMGMLNQNEGNFDPDMLLNGGGFGNDGFVDGLDDLLNNN